jgi:hypothetical protein
MWGRKEEEETSQLEWQWHIWIRMNHQAQKIQKANLVCHIRQMKIDKWERENHFVAYDGFWIKIIYTAENIGEEATKF